MDHNRSGRQVTKATRILADEHGHHADAVGDGQQVNGADQIANDYLGERNRRAVDANHTQTDDALAGRLSIPEDLEENIIAPIKDETQQEQDSEDPIKDLIS